MITKKKVEGGELSFAFSPLQSIQDYFGVVESEGIGKTISRFSPEYHLYRKKIVEEGRLTKWGGLTTGAEKEKIGIMRMRERQKKWSGI